MKRRVGSINFCGPGLPSFVATPISLSTLAPIIHRLVQQRFQRVPVRDAAVDDRAPRRGGRVVAVGQGGGQDLMGLKRMVLS